MDCDRFYGKMSFRLADGVNYLYCNTWLSGWKKLR